MPTPKQKKAQELNWTKAQLLSAHSLMQRARYSLVLHGVKSEEITDNLSLARLALTDILKKWDKIVWGSGGKNAKC